MVWIIVSHLGPFGNGVTDDFQGLMVYYHNWFLQPIYSATLAVDSFFFLRFKISILYLN